MKCAIAYILMLATILGCSSKSHVDAQANKAQFLDWVESGNVQSINGLSVTQDYSEIYTTEWVPGREGETARIMVSTIADRSFMQPEPIFDDQLFSDYQPVLAGENSLFFTSTRPIGSSSKPARQNVWVATRNPDGEWETPRPVKELVSEHWDGHAIDMGEGRILFASSRPGGLGAVDFYEADYLGGKSSNTTNASALNSEDSDQDSTFDQHSGILIFSRYSDTDKDIDLYYSRRMNDGWQPALPLNSLNSDVWELSPVLTPDGCHLLFQRAGVLGFKIVETATLDIGLACHRR